LLFVAGEKTNEKDICFAVHYYLALRCLRHRQNLSRNLSRLFSPIATVIGSMDAPSKSDMTVIVTGNRITALGLPWAG
jgi:hypothetical protein